MTIIRAQQIGDRAILTRKELEQLLKLAQRSEEIELQWDDLPTLAVMRLAEKGGAFDFWHEPGEDVYSLEDGEPL